MSGSNAPSSRQWLGVDIGGTKILALRVDDACDTVECVRVPTPAPFTPDVVCACVTSLVRESVARHGALAGVGVGFPGLVDPRTGRVHASPILPEWEDVPLGERLRDALGHAVVVDNDATAAGYGEYVARGSTPGLNMALLTVGTGIGGALIIDGEVFRGRAGSAGEIGNMSIDFDGARCWCGSRGCLNTFASGTAIARAGTSEAGDDCDGTASEAATAGALEALVRAADAGDHAARRALERGAVALGAGIANVLNLLNPDLVVLSGGVMEIGDAFFERIRTEARSRAFSVPAEHALIERSVRGGDVGALGAACLARERATEAA